MTSLEFYALLAVVDLVSLFITIWVGIVPVSVGWVLIVLVAIPLVDMIRSSLRGIVRDLFGL